MMMTYNCLILLATYNGEKYIKEQLDSILTQQGIKVKIVVSDDSSSDRTLEIIRSYSDSRIEILPSNQTYGSASQNFFRLIRDASFEGFDYIAFADQDDIWYKDKLIRAAGVIEAKGIDAYASNVLAFWVDGTKKLIDKAGSQKESDFLFASSGPGCTCVFSKQFMLDFKRDLIENSQLSQEIDLHDWLFYAYARRNNYTWFTDNEPSMLYRQHSNNVFGANSGLKTYITRWKKSRNGWYRNQILITANFCKLDSSVIRRLKRNSYWDRLVLATKVFNFRKRPIDSLFLAIILIVPGFK